MTTEGSRNIFAVIRLEAAGAGVDRVWSDEQPLGWLLRDGSGWVVRSGEAFPSSTLLGRAGSLFEATRLLRELRLSGGSPHEL